MQICPKPGMVYSVTSEQPVAIVVPDSSERQSLHQFLMLEGFPVEVFPRPADFIKDPDPARYGCLIVDVDDTGSSDCDQSLIYFATRWSHELPVILIASDATQLPKNPVLPGIEKSAGRIRLLYLLYGALSEPAPYAIPKVN